ncbi:MAG: hypothetical protein Q8N84_03080 [bacterium]|nr:hypothetical protein [bacterium]
MNHKYETLHCHTINSDGKLTHQEVLDLFAKNNIGVVAFTDHDALPSPKETEWLLANRQHPAKWIIGCELSSGWPKEMGGIGSNFHILGLFVDPSNKALNERNLLFQKERVARLERMVKNLQKIGFEVTIEECLQVSKGESVGRPHLAAIILGKKTNLDRLDQIRLEMAQASVKDPDLKIRYDGMMLRGQEQYPYALLLSADSFIPGVYTKYEYFTNLEETVGLIHNAGGVAILAHWTFSKKEFGLDKIEKLLADKKIDGAEIIYGLGVIDRATEIAADIEAVKNLTVKYQALQTGGLDFHAAKDVEYFLADKKFAGATVGLAAKLLCDSRVDPQWSSLS